MKLLSFLLLLPLASCTLFRTETLEQKAARIHDEVLTIDTHVDTPLKLGRTDFDLNVRHDPRNRGGKVDFPRMVEGGLDAIFFAVFVGQGPRTEKGNQKVKERSLKIFDAIHKALKESPQNAQLALNADDAYEIEKTGKRAVYIGIENGYAMGNDLSLIKKYYDLGARYITICHTRNNDICDSSTDDPEHSGLSLFGEKVVAEMNRLGIMVDLSHASDEAFYDVLKVTKAPVIASHSCARAICDSPRNLSDDMLKELAKNGGVIQMCILSSYVKKPAPNPEREAAQKDLRKRSKNFDTLPTDVQDQLRKEWDEFSKKYPQDMATVSDAVDHIDHIVKVAGIDHVGIGTDFDGGGGIADCYDVSEMGNITFELVKRGYSEEEIRKIWGGNLIRVFREVEKLAKEQ